MLARTLLALALAAVLLAGCGSQTLQQQSKSLKALAAEGGLLAGNAARGRSTNVFMREHTGFLLKSARSSASALAAQTSTQGRELARLATRVRDDLERLERSGSDRAEQQRLQTDLERIAKRL
jgi:flavin-dependent dehydrogenase